MNVSVIVSIYNCGDVLPTTVPALLSQDFPAERMEIILVDDASTDSTRSVLETPQWEKRCTLIRHGENRGRCATRNSGLDRATGDILIFMDCDIEVDSTFVSQHARLHENPDAIGILSNVQPGSRPLKDKYHRYLFEGKRGAKLIGPHAPLPFRYFIMTCASIKASAVRKTGRFNEHLLSYGIDLEYAYRLWKHYPNGLFYAPEITVWMHRLKTLDEALTDFRAFGRFNVPVILNDNPVLASYVGGDFVKRPRTGFSQKSTTGRFLFNGFTRAIGKKLYRVTPYPFSSYLVRYLMVNSLIQGYREFLLMGATKDE